MKFDHMRFPGPGCWNFCPCECQGDGWGLSGIYAQYGVTANPPSGSLLPLFERFRGGAGIRLQDENHIYLAPGFIYQVDYVFLATPEPGGYFQVTPELNGTLALLYSSFAPSGTQRNATAAAGFTTNAAEKEEALLAFKLTYPDTVRNIDISGAVSVTPVARAV